MTNEKNSQIMIVYLGAKYMPGLFANGIIGIKETLLFYSLIIGILKENIFTIFH